MLTYVRLASVLKPSALSLQLFLSADVCLHVTAAFSFTDVCLHVNAFQMLQKPFSVT